MKIYLLLAIAIAADCTAAAAPRPARATLIVVDKSDHVMHVYAKDKIIATYRVGFGTSPVGHKQQEGDRRTPEGKYTLDYKNANSTFFKSIHISYPNAADKANAKRLGVKPGGDIMIHGGGIGKNWTWGCIALKNKAIDELFDLLPLRTRIKVL